MKKILVLAFLCLFSIGLMAKGIELLGAGATFPYPLYSKMFSEYYKITGVKVNYQSIGSGGGLRQVKNKTVDFGASDAFVSDKKLKDFPAPIVHIPTVLGSVVIVYNIPGVNGLKLTPDVLSGIFLGKITKWNDARIQKINKGIKLPNLGIMVAHRADGSGTTFIFSDYMCKISKEWKDKVGRGKSLNWPCGMGGKGNEGVAGVVKQIPGAIGYVEFAYAKQNRMNVAALRNKSGNFVLPTLENVSKAADVDLPDDMRISITNSSAPLGYPIVGFTYIILYKDLKNGNLSYAHAKAVKKLVWWMTHDGQRYAKPLDYAPLSENAKKKVEKILNSLTYDGKPLR